MKNAMTWLGTGVLVAVTVASGCTVDVSTTGTGGATGGTGGSGGSTGGTGGATTGGAAGTGTAGTGGASGSAGSATDGGAGSSADASLDKTPDAPQVCEVMTSDNNCRKCAFEMCKTEHCACFADTIGCGPDLDQYYKCVTTPGADTDACALDFSSGMTRNEAGADLANVLATCIDTNCIDRCLMSADAGGSSG